MFRNCCFLMEIIKKPLKKTKAFLSLWAIRGSHRLEKQMVYIGLRRHSFSFKASSSMLHKKSCRNQKLHPRSLFLHPHTGLRKKPRLRQATEVCFLQQHGSNLLVLSGSTSPPLSNLSAFHVPFEIPLSAI